MRMRKSELKAEDGMATPSVQEQIKAQGEIVRQLKKDKAPEEKVTVSVAIPFQTISFSGSEYHVEIT